MLIYSCKSCASQSILKALWIRPLHIKIVHPHIQTIYCIFYMDFIAINEFLDHLFIITCHCSINAGSTALGFVARSGCNDFTLKHDTCHGNFPIRRRIASRMLSKHHSILRTVHRRPLTRRMTAHSLTGAPTTWGQQRQCTSTCKAQQAPSVNDSPLIDYLTTFSCFLPPALGGLLFG